MQNATQASMPNESENSYLETLPNGISFEMAKVEGSAFQMGSDEYSSEQPIHEVNVPSFYIGKYPVTQALWKAIMGTNPSRFQGKNHPVERVSWDDTLQFIEKINRITGKTYRLPSEAEWEYAARGGQKSRGFRYAGSNKLKEVGWYNLNSHGETKPVGLKLPNELDIYDMSGNVWEWCADHWHGRYEGAPNDGRAWVDGGDSAVRVVRGGSWLSSQYYCRPSSRHWDRTDSRNDNFGFRLARY